MTFFLTGCSKHPWHVVSRTLCFSPLGWYWERAPLLARKDPSLFVGCPSPLGFKEQRFLTVSSHSERAKAMTLGRQSSKKTKKHKQDKPTGALTSTAVGGDSRGFICQKLYLHRKSSEADAWENGWVQRAWSWFNHWWIHIWKNSRRVETLESYWRRPVSRFSCCCEVISCVLPHPPSIYHCLLTHYGAH